MIWDGFRTGFVDELAKIAEFSLRGLSPDTVMSKSQPPPPMETPGFDKARDILSRVSQTKTAASRKIQRALPQQPGVGKLVHQGDDSASEKAKSVAGYGLAGIGTGKVLSELGTRSPWATKWQQAAVNNTAEAARRAGKLSNTGWGAMVGGGAAGLAYGANRLHQKSLAKKGTIVKTATLTSPAMALKASKQVGKVKVTPSVSGPSTTTQIRGQLIGKKGIP